LGETNCLTEIRYTLVCDGSSDRMLIPILNWLIESLSDEIAVQAQWADFGRLRNPPTTLSRKLRYAIELYPCELLFVHRDAEAQSPELRKAEILLALHESELSKRAVCVIPVRMSEAWLPLDERAIRMASGSPTSRVRLELPALKQAEQVANPKEMLFQAIRDASGLAGRRLKNLNVHFLRHRVAELMDDRAILRGLPSFKRLEEDLIAELRASGWT